MQWRNKLEPQGNMGRLSNFLLNLFWAIVWLGRWGMRFLGKFMGK